MKLNATSSPHFKTKYKQNKGFLENLVLMLTNTGKDTKEKLQLWIH